VRPVDEPRTELRRRLHQQLDDIGATAAHPVAPRTEGVGAVPGIPPAGEADAAHRLPTRVAVAGRHDAGRGAWAARPPLAATAGAGAARAVTTVERVPYLAAGA